MRLMVAALAALWMTIPASASPHTDDRYFDSRATVAPAKVKARKETRHYTAPRRIVRHVARVKYRRTAWRAAVPVEQASVLGGRPAGAPRAWCGFWLGRHLGMLARNLWLARNWAHVGSPAGKHVGAIVVWAHHVGKITAVRADGAIKVLSGNDGRAVRDRWRSARGVIAYRAL